MRAPFLRTGLPAALALLCAGCVNLAPPYQQPVVPLPQPQFVAAPVGASSPAEVDWQTFITDARLRELIDLGLQNNRDLRVAALRIEQARAQYRIEQSALLPAVGAAATGSRQRTPATASSTGQAATSSQYAVNLGISSYELDVFGRLRNLSDAALENFFAVTENRRSAQLSLVAELATAWLTLAADGERLQLARETLRSRQASFELTRRMRELGGSSGLQLAQSQTLVDSARLDVARYDTRLAQDRNALELLLGGALPPALLPASAAGTPASLLVELPAGLPSAVLQRRPDVLAAEHLLRAANADIGAARAALFPSITLTAAAGTQSRSLADLFASGSGAWSFAPRVDLALFDGGRRRANVQLSETARDIELASYEKVVQTAFREVADALAERGTLAEQLAAQQSLTAATQRSLDLSTALFRNGASSYLEVLDAQRSLYTAQQNSITLQLAEQVNRVTLYKALGGT